MTFMALYKGMGDLKLVIAVYRHRQIIRKGRHPKKILWVNVGFLLNGGPVIEQLFM